MTRNRDPRLNSRGGTTLYRLLYIAAFNAPEGHRTPEALAKEFGIEIPLAKRLTHEQLAIVEQATRHRGTSGNDSDPWRLTAWAVYCEARKLDQNRTRAAHIRKHGNTNAQVQALLRAQKPTEDAPALPSNLTSTLAEIARLKCAMDRLTYTKLPFSEKKQLHADYYFQIQALERHAQTLGAATPKAKPERPSAPGQTARVRNFDLFTRLAKGDIVTVVKLGPAPRDPQMPAMDTVRTVQGRVVTIPRPLLEVIPEQTRTAPNQPEPTRTNSSFSEQTRTNPNLSFEVRA